MMRLSLFVSLSWLAIATIVSACGGGAPPTITPASQAPKITLTTNPNPPTSGEVEVIAMVTDANGQPLDAAEVFVFGNHTEMTGMTMNGKATAQGNGRYSVKTKIGMGGKWKFTVQVKKPPLDVAEIFNLEFK